MAKRLTRKQRLLRRGPLVIWLTLVWVLLWGTLDLGTLVFGLSVALLVSVLFPAPPIRTGMVLRPFQLLRLIGYLAWDLVISTMRVTWQALRFGPNATAGIVAARLHVDSDHLTALIASAISLAPGQFVLQIDRVDRICYVYALCIDDEESVRREVARLERFVVAAVGSAEQREMLQEAG
ncbi:Na+/H+ antiporter subunit E [Saccharopolyspora griseoalba]|uniref:Na+/H+ antiporter subunit E n=1 Tax=Saccharopolyspora griseoalba TaxID=1431848 RepID=A0ABW2LGI0_9PSEU